MGEPNWQAAYEDTKRQFQQETLRTSEYYRLTERIMTKLMQMGHMTKLMQMGHRADSLPPCQHCDICKWLIDVKELMARPINVASPAPADEAGQVQVVKRAIEDIPAIGGGVLDLTPSTLRQKLSYEMIEKIAETAVAALRALPPQPTDISYAEVPTEQIRRMNEHAREPRPTGDVSAAPLPFGSHQGEALPNGDAAVSGATHATTAGDNKELVERLRQRGHWGDRGRAWEQDPLCAAAADALERADSRSQQYLAQTREATDRMIAARQSALEANGNLIEVRRRIAELDAERQHEMATVQEAIHRAEAAEEDIHLAKGNLPADLQSTSIGDGVRALHNRLRAAEQMLQQSGDTTKPTKEDVTDRVFGPAFERKCNNPSVTECRLSECQEAGECRRATKEEGERT